MAEKCTQQLKMHQRLRHPDQETNFTGFHKIFIPVQMCRTFSANPINMRLSEKFEAQIVLQRPD
jgi:hypothetical protein